MGHQYKLLHSTYQEALARQVNEHLEIGWELWGNPFCAGQYTINQALVRFEPTTIPDKMNLDALTQPAGFSTQVPETPMEKGYQAQGLVSPEAEYLPKVESVRPLFSGILCCCEKRAGDNPDCTAHRRPAGRIR
jgi:hypothetical protein